MGRCRRDRPSTSGFLRQEWEQVVQANGIETLDDYLQGASHWPGPDADPTAAGPGLEGVRALPASPRASGASKNGCR